MVYLSSGRKQEELMSGGRGFKWSYLQISWLELPNECYPGNLPFEREISNSK